METTSSSPSFQAVLHVAPLSSTSSDFLQTELLNIGSVSQLENTTTTSPFLICIECERRSLFPQQYQQVISYCSINNGPAAKGKESRHVAINAQLRKDPILVVNEKFCQFFHFEEGDVIHIRYLTTTDDLYPLQSVTLIRKVSNKKKHAKRSKNEEEEEEADEEQFNMFKNKLIYRDLWIEDDYFVSDCKPFLFGVVNQETQVVVLDSTFELSHLKESQENAQTKKKKKLQISTSFTERLQSNEAFSLFSESATAAAAASSESSETPRMQHFVIKEWNHFATYNAISKKNNNVDPQAIAIVSMHTLRSKFHCLSKTWTQLQYHDSVDKQVERSRWVFLVALDDTYNLQDDTIYVSSYLYFQIFQNPSARSTGERAVKINVNGVKNDSEVEYFKEVVISPITSPNHFSSGPSGEQGDGGGMLESASAISSHEFPKQCFECYFEHGRVVCEGDIICIPHLQTDEISFDELSTIDFMEHDLLSPKFDPVHSHFSYFKIVQVTHHHHHHHHNSNAAAGEGIHQHRIESCGRVAHNKSDLITKGETNSFLPYFDPNALFHMKSSWVSSIVQELSHYSRIKKILNVLISPSFDANPRSTANGMPFLKSILMYGNKGTGKESVVRKLAQEFGTHLIDISSYELLGEGDHNTEDHVRQMFNVAKMCMPCILYLKQFEAIAGEDSHTPSHMKASKIRIVKAIQEELNKLKKAPFLFIASCDKIDNISVVFRAGSLFKEKLEIQNSLDFEQRIAVLKSFFAANDSNAGCDSIVLSRDISIEELARQLTGASFMDLKMAVQNAKAHLLQKVQGLVLSRSTASPTTTLPPMVLSKEDFEKYSLQQFKQELNRAIGAPQVPNIKWEDIGGLEKAKQEVLDTIQLPLQQPHLFGSNGLKARSGILLYGPPGTGKTLLAKAVATECQLNFMSVKGPELINMYIGESERNIREVFARARQAKPCVIFFDELDALAPNRGVEGDSGGVMDRVVSQLLAELDSVNSGGSSSSSSSSGEKSVSSKTEIFVIGATNRPDLIDSALLRPGRFDRMVYLGTCADELDILKVIKALTRKFNLDKSVQLERIVHYLLKEQTRFDPLCLTGADYYAICSDALMNSILRITNQIEAKKQEGSITTESEEEMLANVDILVQEEDFMKALETISPSLSAEELQRYATIQKSFKQ